MSVSLVRAYRTIFGLLAFSALVTELAILYERDKLVLGNFFSYFTVESNTFASAVLILSGILLTANGEPTWLAMLRGAATLYLAITGLLFSLILASLEGVDPTILPWDNIVLHYLMPIMMVIDWVVSSPPKRIPFRHGLIWLAFPLIYALYSLIRGYFTQWYPYPFLDPDPRGYTAVVQSCIGVALTALVLVYLLTLFPRPGSLLPRLRPRAGSI
jgi:hypothetical protein